MKICAIGDPHGNLGKIKKIPLNGLDLILVTGDLGKADLARKRFFENQKRKQQGLPELKDDKRHKKEVHMEIHNSTLDVLKYLTHYAPVYTIQGNVGIFPLSYVRKEKSKYGITLPSTAEKINSMNNINLVKNTIRSFEGLRIGFLEYFMDTSWVREFKPRGYNKMMIKARKQTAKAERVLRRFGYSIDILVCHQPPYGVLDKVDFPGIPESWKNKHAGSKAILKYVRKYQPKYVFCGHIHEGEGHKIIGKTEVNNLGVAGYKIIEL